MATVARRWPVPRARPGPSGSVSRHSTKRWPCDRPGTVATCCAGWRHPARLRGADRRGRRGHRVVGRAARRDPGCAGVHTAQGPPQGRHRAVAQRRLRGAVDRACRRGGCRPVHRFRRDHRSLVALRVRRPAGSPGQRRTGGGVRRGGRRADGGRHRAFLASPQQLRSDPDQTVCALRPRAGRHRVVRDPAGSPADVLDRADPSHDAAGASRCGQARPGGSQRVVRPHLDRRARHDARAGAARLRRGHPADRLQPC